MSEQLLLDLPGKNDQRGVAAVEFAFLILLLLLIVAGLVEFGRALWYYDALAKGTRDAARYMSVVPADNLKGEIPNAQAMVLEAARAARVPALKLNQVNVECSPSNCSKLTSVSVSVSYPLQLGELFPFIWSDGTGTQLQGMSLTLSPSTSMPYLW